LDEHRLEGLDAEAVERRCAVQQHRMLLDDALERVPHFVGLQLDELLRGLDRADEALLLELVVDERLEQLERHLLRQTALVQAELRSDDDDRTAGVVDALAEEVLAEASLLALQSVAERLQRAVVRALEHAAAAAVVEERVDRFLEHALFIADDDVRRAQLEELLETVVAVDDAAIEIVQIRRREAAAVERHERAQLRRDDRDHVEDHPVGTVARLAEGVDDLQPLGGLQLFDLRGLGAHDEAQLVAELFDVDAPQQLLDRFRAHLGDEHVAVLRAQLAILLLGEKLFLMNDAFEVAGVDDDVRLEVEDPLEVAEADVEQVSDARRQALEEPDVRHRRGQLDVAHALAADFGLRDFDTAFVADDASVLHPFVFTAEAFPVGDRTEDLRAEQAVALGLEGAVVDRLRLGDFAVGPRPDLLRRREADLDGVEIVDRLRFCRLKQCVEAFQFAPPVRVAIQLSVVVGCGNCSLMSLPKHSQHGASHSVSPVWKCTVMRIAPMPWQARQPEFGMRDSVIVLRPMDGYSFSSSTSRQRDCSSRTSTLNDSGRPGSSGTSPLTMAS